MVITLIIGGSLLRRVLPRQTPAQRFLVLDGGHSLADMRERGVLPVITARDLDGWFEHVWTVHSLIGANPEQEASGRTEVTTLTDRHTVIEGSVHDRRIPASLPRLGLAVTQFDLHRRLHRVMRRERVGIVQASDPFYQGIIAWLLARTHRVPFAVRVAGNYDAMYDSGGHLAYPRLLPSRRLQSTLGRFVLHRCNLVLAVNDDNRSFAVRNGASLSRTIVIPAYGNVLHPLHRADPATRRAPDRLPPRPYAIAVSRLEPVKHIDDVVTALGVARVRHPGLSLVIVGDGSQHAELREQCRVLGLEDAVLLVGERNQEWIAAALAAASVVVSPLTGRALVEAALSATPIVAYDVEWQSELIADGVTGRLVAYRDTDAMAEAISDLLDDEAVSAQLGVAARVATLELVDPDRLHHRMVEGYKSTMACTGGRTNTTKPQ